LTSTSWPGKPLQALHRPKASPAGAGLWISVVLLLLFAGTTLPARASEADDYTAAIHRALTLVQFAERGDAPSLQQAIAVLGQAAGSGQPEILADLRAEPPRLADADQRLQALFTALQGRVDTPDPSLAAQRLHQVLSMPRYAGLSTGPSIPDQILAAIIGAISWLLSWLGVGNLHLNLPLPLLLGLSLLIIGTIAALVLRGGFSPGGRDARLRPGKPAPRVTLDFFAEADRMAAAGDYRGAIRMVAGGVAVAISGEHAWDRSPLTVRELFSRSERMETLRPLLLQFEEAIYGHRPADASAYERAIQAAAPYRRVAA
jgi:hypothetical protein